MTKPYWLANVFCMFKDTNSLVNIDGYIFFSFWICKPEPPNNKLIIVRNKTSMQYAILMTISGLNPIIKGITDASPPLILC